MLRVLTVMGPGLIHMCFTKWYYATDGKGTVRAMRRIKKRPIKYPQLKQSDLTKKFKIKQ